MDELFFIEDIPDELWFPKCLHGSQPEGPSSLVDPTSVERLLELECVAFAAIWGTKGKETRGFADVIGLKLKDVRESEGTGNGDPPDSKRMKRTEFNNESARRSRARKKEFLSELEMQVGKLKDEDAKLQESLVKARKKYDDAVVNNRILKADNETLKVKVQMLELTTSSASQEYVEDFTQNY